MKRTVTIIEDERRTRLFRLPEGSRAEHQQLRKGLMVLGEGDIVVLPSQLHDPDATIRFALGCAPGAVSVRRAPDRLPELNKRVDERLPNDEAKLNVRPPADPHQLDLRFEHGEVRVKDVLTRPDHDELDDDVVSAIAESQGGPFVPIIVRRIPPEEQRKPGGHAVELIRGRQRLEAARLRGMERIRCLFFSGSQTAARIVGIEEDLFRKKHTVLRRAERLVEWAELIEKTGFRVSGQVVRKRQGRPPKWLYQRLAELPAIGRSAEARRQTFQRASKIAAIPQEAKDVAIAGGLDDNQDALLAIARAGPAKAVKKAKELVGKLQERMRETTNTPPSRVAAGKAQRGGVHKSPLPQPNSDQHDDQSSDAEPTSPQVPKETTLDDLNDFWKRGGPKLWKYAPFSVRTAFKEKLDRVPYAAMSDVVEFIQKVFSGRKEVYVGQLYAFAKTQGIRRKILRVHLRALGYKLSKDGPQPAAPRFYRNKDSNWKEQLRLVPDAELEAPLAAEQNGDEQDQSDLFDERPPNPYYADI